MWIGPEDHKVVGAHLEAVRKEAGVTQVELAKRLRKPQSFVSSYENGQRRLDLLELIAVVRALDGDPQAICAAIIGKVNPSRKSPSRNLGGHKRR